MNGSQLEGSRQAIKWSICLDRILYCNGTLLVASFGFAVGVAVLHLPLHWLLEGEKTTKTKYFIYIDIDR